jgi:hypothetical protein
VIDTRGLVVIAGAVLILISLAGCGFPPCGHLWPC